MRNMQKRHFPIKFKTSGLSSEALFLIKMIEYSFQFVLTPSELKKKYYEEVLVENQ